jgi:hypothetical protein
MFEFSCILSVFTCIIDPASDPALAQQIYAAYELKGR